MKIWNLKSSALAGRMTLAAVAACLCLAAAVVLSRRAGHDPEDLSHWVRVAGDRDWSAEAARGNAEAQFLHGITLLRSNLAQSVDRVPVLSQAPLVGGLFENVSYRLTGDAAREPLVGARRWIQKSADQGYAPAQAAARLFRSKAVRPSAVP